MGAEANDFLRTIGITPRTSSYHFLGDDELPLAMRTPLKMAEMTSTYLMEVVELTAKALY